MLRRALLITSLLALCAGCATVAPDKKSADALFKEGEDFYAAKQYDDAIAQWKKVKETFSSPQLTAMAELKIADAQFDNENYIEAAASYEDFRKFHPKHEKAPYALYRLALCNYRQIEGIDTDQTPVKNAATLFTTFLRDYPDDPQAGDVREKLESCRTKQLAYEIYVGKFYLRTEKYRAAMKRLDEALAQYPGIPSLRDEALLYLGEAAILSGDKARGREAFDRLFKEFGASRYVGEARKFMEKNY